MENIDLQIGHLFTFKSYDKIRKAIFMEENENIVTCILKGDPKTEGIKVKINKNQIIKIL